MKIKIKNNKIKKIKIKFIKNFKIFYKKRKQ